VITRRAFLGTLGGGRLAAPPAAEAQPPGEVYRVGLLSPTSAAAPSVVEAFGQGLRELGWHPAQNVRKLPPHEDSLPTDSTTTC
jgi:hypothetical protein